MKNLKSIIPLLVGMYILITFISCGDDSDGVSTSAVLGGDITANNGDVVEISFSSSSAPEGTEYRLTYAIAAVDRNGSRLSVEDTEGNSYNEGNVLLSTTDKSETFSFIPGQNGVYVFQLNVGDSQDQITVTVSGPIVLTTANISNHTTLLDQNGTNRSDLSDYRIADILTISDLTVLIEDDVQIVVDDNAGIILDNGTLTRNGGSFSNLIGENWKGILVKNSGELRIHNLYISKMGDDSFDGYKPAIVTVENGMIGMQGSTLQGSQESSTGIHLLEEATVNPDFILSDNTLNTQETISCNVFQSELVVGNTTDFNTAYITISGMGDTFIATGDGDYSLNPGYMDIYFKGGVTISDFSIFQLQPGKGIYFEEETGLVLSQGGRILGESNSFVKGWDGSSWKGILMGGNIGSWIQNVSIENAGSSAHTLSNSISSSIYLNGRIDIFSNVVVADGASYGVYIANGTSFSNSSSNLSGNSYSNLADAAIIGPADLVTDLLIGTHDFGDNSDNPSVKIKSPESTSGEIIFDDLNNGNYYLVEDNLNFSSTAIQLWIREGAHLKFVNSASLYIGATTSGQVNLLGTSEKPVTLTANDQTEGWGGVYLGSSGAISYSIDYAEISYGGNTLLTGATDQANLILESTSNSFDCTNSTLSNSKGYGVVIESSSNSFDFEGVANSNSFSNNASGNVNDKTN